MLGLLAAGGEEAKTLVATEGFLPPLLDCLQDMDEEDGLLLADEALRTLVNLCSNHVANKYLLLQTQGGLGTILRCCGVRHRCRIQIYALWLLRSLTYHPAGPAILLSHEGLLPALVLVCQLPPRGTHAVGEPLEANPLEILEHVTTSLDGGRGL